jgi:membrane fusion protein, multidrug efflux system
MTIKKIIAAVLLLTAVSCTQNKPVDLAAKKEMQSFRFCKPTSKTISSSIQLPGELKPFQEVKIFPKVNGFIKDVLVDRGSKVHAGEVLILLEAPEVEQQLQMAKEKYIQAEAVFNTSKDKYERLQLASKTDGAVSVFDLENAKSKMNEDESVENAEKSNVAALEAMKGYLTVTAPFEGIISERNVHPGALVGPNEKMEMPMLKLEQENKLRLVVFIPEAFTNKINKIGMVTFKLASFPGKIFDGVISRSAGSLNEGIRSEAVEIDVTSNNNIIKPGMSAEVDIPLSSDASAYVVPSSAIITSTEKKYVIEVLNNKTKFIEIKEGISKNDSTEIFGNITGQEAIITNGNTEIKENEEVH